MHRIKPVEHLLHGFAAGAALTIVKPDQHESQRRGQFESEQHRAHEALLFAVRAGQIQGAEDEYADAIVVRIGGKGQQYTAAGTEEAFPAGRAVRCFKVLQACHGQHAQRQRPVNVLIVRIERRAEKRQVKRDLAHQPEQKKPPDVLFDVMGVHKAFHQQKTEDGKRQPPGEAQELVQMEQGKLLHRIAGESTGFQLGHQKPGLKAGSPDVIDQHGAAGDVLEGGAAESAAGCGKNFRHRKNLREGRPCP